MKNQPIKIADVPCCVSTLTLGPEDVAVFVVPPYSSEDNIRGLCEYLANIPSLAGKSLVVLSDIRIIELKRLEKELEE